jgi:hypothetical protein
LGRWGRGGGPPAATRRGDGGDGHPPGGTRRPSICKASALWRAHKFPRGDAHRLRLSRKLFVLVGSCALLISGCGESEDVADGATVTAYVVAPLCAEAERELAKHGGEAGDFHVRAICLPSAESSRKLNLTQIGVNARQATEDSSAIAYIGEPTYAAFRFSHPILAAAEIPQLPQSSGAKAMAKVLEALSQSTGGSLRQSVNDALH